jgi:hypothetical protein
MTRVLLSISLFWLLLAAGCATVRVPGKYVLPTWPSGETLALEADFTFTLTYWTDVVGFEVVADGTWAWTDRGDIRTTVDFWNGSIASVLNPLPRNQVWEVTRKGLRRGNSIYRRVESEE